MIEQWRFLHRLAGRMGLQLGLYPALGEVIHIEGSVPLQLDMTRDPDVDELFEHIHTGSRIPFSEIRRHPRGALFPDPPVHVRPRDPGWEGRLDVGNDVMLTDLRAELTAPEPDDYPFRLISRRLMHVMNAPTFAVPESRTRYNPAFLNPGDLAGLGVEAGDVVEIRSDRAAILAVAEADDTVRPGTVSVSHAFGGLPGEEEDVREVGSNTGRLVAEDGVHDRFSGQPRMSNVPVRIGPAPTDGP